MKLKNGFSVISKSKCKEQGYVILAQRRRYDDTMEYVTWITDDNMNCYYGHYMDNIEDGTRDYKDRVIQYC